MNLLTEIIFWSSFFLLAHTYVLYPIILNFLAKHKTQNSQVFTADDELPKISILLAVYNEALVIEEKIKKTFATNYPLDKIEFLIGSDASTDTTDTIIKKYQAQFPQIKLTTFAGRTGKPGIINQLAAEATNEVFVITDANVFFTPTTFFELVKHFKNESIGLVGGNILNSNLKSDGISHQEKTYLKGENSMKYNEGVIWGAMIGTFGGVYAIRKTSYEPVPSKFTVDDFYITMAVLEKKQHVIMELEAIAYEDVSNQISEEFRRKTRISIGNFQNLKRFSGLLANPFKGVAFAFFSHKVARWLGPIFLLSMLVTSFYLQTYHPIYKLAFIGEIAFLLLPLIDSVFRKLKVHFYGLRFVSHFIWMNLALLNGLIKFLIGVKSNIWTPTQRNQ